MLLLAFVWFVCCGFLAACCLFGCLLDLLFDLLLPIRPGAAARSWVRDRVQVQVQDRRLQQEFILAEQEDLGSLVYLLLLLMGCWETQETSVYVRFSLLYKRDENKTNLAYKNLLVKEAHSSQREIRGEPC